MLGEARAEEFFSTELKTAAALTKEAAWRDFRPVLLI